MTEKSIINHDSSNCKRDPIHLPSCIQPHGILLVLQERNLTILQASENTFEVLKIRPKDLVGCKISELLGAGQTELLQQTIGDRLDFQEVNPIELSGVGNPWGERRRLIY